jgi:hypothetical protein
LAEKESMRRSRPWLEKECRNCKYEATMGGQRGGRGTEEESLDSFGSGRARGIESEEGGHFGGGSKADRRLRGDEGRGEGAESSPLSVKAAFETCVRVQAMCCSNKGAKKKKLESSLLKAK